MKEEEWYKKERSSKTVGGIGRARNDSIRVCLRVCVVEMLDQQKQDCWCSPENVKRRRKK